MLESVRSRVAGWWIFSPLHKARLALPLLAVDMLSQANQLLGVSSHLQYRNKRCIYLFTQYFQTFCTISLYKLCMTVNVKCNNGTLTALNKTEHMPNCVVTLQLNIVLPSDMNAA